jgi:hypothetical protein
VRHSRAETAQTWTETAYFSPQSVPGLTVDAHYYSTDSRNRIEQPQFLADALVNPSDQRLITYNPTAAQRASVCASSTFSGARSDCVNARIDAIVDLRLQNIARLRTRGLDLNALYQFDSFPGAWTLGFTGSYVFRYTLSDLSGSRDWANTVGYPLRFRFRDFVSLKSGQWESTVYLLYSAAYHDVISASQRDIGSWATFNAQFAWKPPLNKWGRDTSLTVSLSLLNVFGRAPPFVDNPLAVGWDHERECAGAHDQVEREPWVAVTPCPLSSSSMM